MVTALLEVVTDPFGYTAIGCIALALSGLGMMITGTAQGTAQRAWSAGLIVAALAYTAGNIFDFVATISADTFAIFQFPYIAAAGIVGPALMIIAAGTVYGVFKCFRRLTLSGFALWTACSGFAHLWWIAVAAAGV